MSTETITCTECKDAGQHKIHQGMETIHHDINTIWTTHYESGDSIIMTMSFLSCSCLCVVDFLAIFQKLNPQKKAALEEQCRDWKVFCSISHPHRWELVVDNLIKSVGGSLATDLDNLWKQLHPSQSTGLSHSIHSTSWIQEYMNYTYLLWHAYDDNNHRMSW